MTKRALAPDDIVLRFGFMRTADLLLAARTARVQTGRDALSVWADPGCRDHQALAGAIPLPHRVHRVATVRTLQGAGFLVSDVDERGHLAIVLGGGPSVRVVRALVACFGPPIDRQVPGGEPG